MKSLLSREALVRTSALLRLFTVKHAHSALLRLIGALVKHMYPYLQYVSYPMASEQGQLPLAFCATSI